MIELLSTENLAALLTLTGLEIVLGIDNIVFISVLTGRLPARRQGAARRLGLSLAMILRILLLLAITWVMRLTAPLLSVGGTAISGKDLILLAGGLFLIGKATWEIHAKLEGTDHSSGEAGGRGASFGWTIAQILLLDIVFSLDSVITAIGMARAIPIMVASIVLAVAFMLAFAGAVSAFIERHPTMKMLALSFLLLIGVVLVADGLGRHIEKGYVYFAMAFSFGVEMLNMRLRDRARPVRLRQPSYRSPHR